MSYPADLPEYEPFTTPITLLAFNHSGRHLQMQNDIIALATKVGVDASADPNSLESRLSEVEDWMAIAQDQISDAQTDILALDARLDDIIDGTEALTTPQILNFGSAQHDHEDAAGGGVLTALAISNPYKFSAYKSANSTANDGIAIDPVIFNTELFDTNNNYNNATGVWTVPVTGYYQVNVGLYITRNDLGSPANGDDSLWHGQAFLRNNTTGVDIDMAEIYFYSGGRITTFHAKMSRLHFLTAGDQIRCRAYSDTVDGDVWRLGGGRHLTYFDAHFVTTT